MYLGHTVTYNNSDWAEIYRNLRKVQRIRRMEEKVLGKTEAPIKSRARMYKTVVQAGLLYKRKICVVKDAMMTVLEVFRHRIARQITGMTSRKSNGEECESTQMDAGIGDHGYFADKRLRKEAAGKNHRICIRETNLQNLYRPRVDGVLH